MKKIMLCLFFLFFIGSTKLISKDFKTASFFSDSFSWSKDKSNKSILDGANKLIQLRNINNNVTYTSLKTHTDQLFSVFSENNINHHPLVYAKLNFFGINNLEKKEDEENSFKETESSIWDNEIIYFVIGALAATTLYLVWQNSGSDNPPKKTFGLPPKPEGSYGL